ncbi:TerB family tellurite resistance protein [Novosphingobium sp. SG720]|uniref:TerB family tellurite resistance protein n=1 Tax=Novosphingobium sp. SG720 TaxID=2586998 RepID=UPI0014487B6A|nr:putative tellurite resistance protein B-like protein [Novosphingobium sp. SG720]
MAIGGAIALAVLVCLVIGVGGLIKPAAFGLRSRWYAGLVLAGAIGLVGFGQIASPDPEIADPAVIRRRGYFTFAIWLISSAFLYWKAKTSASAITRPTKPELNTEQSLRLPREWAQARKSGGSPLPEQPIPDRSADEVDARTRAARRAKIAAGAEHAAPPNLVRAKVGSEQALERVAKAVAGKSVPVPMPEWCKPKSAEIEELIELRGRGKSSGWAGFMHYTDANGDTSSRRIVCRSISGNGRPETVTAYCCERKAHRTFRIDRIDELICVETGEVLDPATHFAELWSKGALKVADKTLTDFARVLVFMARCDGEFHPLELQEVEAALWRYGAEFGLDDKTIKTAVRGVGRIAPDSEDFVDSLKRISHHCEARLLSLMLLDSVDQVAAADGRIDEQEVEWASVVSDTLKVMATA